MQVSFNIGQTQFAVESLQATTETVAAMKQGAKDLKKQFKKINIDKVEDLQDELEDMLLENEEIQDVLSRSYGVSAEVDEADLEAELDMLDDMDFEEEGVEEEGGADYLSEAIEMPAAGTGLPAEEATPAAAGASLY